MKIKRIEEERLRHHQPRRRCHPESEPSFYHVTGVKREPGATPRPGKGMAEGPVRDCEGGGDPLGDWQEGGRSPGPGPAADWILWSFPAAPLCGAPGERPSLSQHFLRRQPPPRPPAVLGSSELRPSSGRWDWRMIGPGLRDFGQQNAHQPGGERRGRVLLSFPEHRRALQRAGSGCATLLNLNWEEYDCFQGFVYPESENGKTQVCWHFPLPRPTPN